MAGLNTSNTAAPPLSPNLTAGFAIACVASCANGRAARDEDAAGTISDGPTPSLSRLGCLACGLPISCLLNPLGGNTINWKAGCGKSARPVWREGEPNSIGSPYPDHLCFRPSRLVSSVLQKKESRKPERKKTRITKDSSPRHVWSPVSGVFLVGLRPK